MDGGMDVIAGRWEGGGEDCVHGVSTTKGRSASEKMKRIQRIPATAGGGPGGENRGGSPGWRRGPIRGRPDRLRIHLLIGKCKLQTGVLRC